MDKVKFFRKKLGNGMTVLFEQRKDSGVVSVAFAVKHGGIHEASEEKGISHFIEHMLYKGTKNRTAKKISEDIERNGGILNGFTEEEITAYWCKMPSNKLAIALDVLGDMIKNPLFDEGELNKERLVIFEEMKMRKDRPDIYILDELQSTLFTGNLGLNLIGTEKSMKSIDRSKIIAKFKKIYHPNNLFLCVVGDADFDNLCKFCEKNFPVSKADIAEPSIGLKNKQRIEKRKGIDQANLVFAYHVPNANEKENYSAQVLSCLMAGGMSSRLWQEIREKRNLAYAVRGACSAGRRFGYNYIYVGTTKENVEKVRAVILEEFRRIKELKEGEFEQVKEQLVGNSRISREDSQGQMLDLLYNEIWDKAENSYRYEEEIKKVKLEEVKKMAEKVKEGNYSFIALLPE